MRKFGLLTLALSLGLNLSSFAQIRTKQLLDKNWRFTREDKTQFSTSNYNDAKWQKVEVPHDWAIYGPFSIDNDKQVMAIEQDGQTSAMVHAGRTGGLPFVGSAWYRRNIELKHDKNKVYTLIFDGAMSNAEVYVNGEHLKGNTPYGYNSFHLDASKLIKDGKNTIAVRLNNLPEASRWYPGAGLYRNVYLQTTSNIHIPVNGTFVKTPRISKELAQVTIDTELSYPNNIDYKNLSITTYILDAQNKVVAKSTNKLDNIDKNKFFQSVEVANPILWDIDNPYLYTAKSEIYNGKELVDEYSSRFGIRSIEIIPNKGFFLNGKETKFKGVCNHHDLGMLGAAVNDAAIRRQIRILKDMGANAIRTSHNMPAPELIRAADEMGIMIMAESFDEWKTPKMANGYNLVFDEWADKDLTYMIRQFRNSPSIVMWCIGNEVSDQWKGTAGAKLTRLLQDVCHREDPTRFVTNGMDAPDAVIANGMAAILDVAGFNYRPHKYQENYEKLPQDIILGSETASTFSSRGVYKFPVERQSMKKYPDHQASSYDVEHAGWSNLPEDDWMWHEDNPWSIGEFVWTGFDYIGEPTPYYTDWPSHSSLFGIVDLAGIPKDRFYLYRSHWNKEAETLHILPHWNWEGREGQTTPIFVYTNYPKAELFINGVSQGIREKDLSVTIENSKDEESMKNFKRQRRYRLMWMDTKYEAGTVKVVAYDKDGKVAATKEIKTAGKPYKLVLEPDRNTIKADGKDISFLTVKVVDKDGNLCPNAQNQIKYEVSGAGFYRAGANGDPTSLEIFHKPQMKVFYGMMTIAVQNKDAKKGKIKVTAKAKGLQNGSIEIEAK